MENYLNFYNYKKISLIIKKKSNGELNVNDILKEIKINSIYEQHGEQDEIKKNLREIDFVPLKDNIPRNIYFKPLSEKTIEFFNNFVIVNKELYDEIRRDDKNINGPNYTFEYENKINLCLVDNIFIYEIAENILGFGIPEFAFEYQIPIFKIKFLIIMNDDLYGDENFNTKTEIERLFYTKDLEKYLMLDRGVRFENQNPFKVIEMKIVNNKIGILYNLEDFNIELYWKRTKEEYEKKIKELEDNKLQKRLEETKKKEQLKKKRELIKKNELEQDKRIKQAEEQKKKIQKKEEEERAKVVKKFENKINSSIEREQINKEFIRTIGKIKNEKYKKIYLKNEDNISKNENFRYNKNEYINNKSNDEQKEENINYESEEKTSLNQYKNIEFVNTEKNLMTPNTKYYKNNYITNFNTLCKSNINFPKIEKNDILKTEEQNNSQSSSRKNNNLSKFDSYNLNIETQKNKTKNLYSETFSNEQNNSNENSHEQKKININNNSNQESNIEKNLKEKLNDKVSNNFSKKNNLKNSKNKLFSTSTNFLRIQNKINNENTQNISKSQNKFQKINFSKTKYNNNNKHLLKKNGNNLKDNNKNKSFYKKIEENRTSQDILTKIEQKNQKELEKFLKKEQKKHEKILKREKEKEIERNEEIKAKNTHRKNVYERKLRIDFINEQKNREIWEIKEKYNRKRIKTGLNIK